MLLEKCSFDFTWSLWFSLKQNVRKLFKNDKVTTIFDHASRAYRISYFDTQMKELRKINKKVYRYLIEANVHKWSYVYYPVWRYYLMIANIVESLNFTLKHVHKLLITTFVEFVCDMIRRLFYNMRNATERT